MSAKKSKRLKLEDRVTILRRLDTGELSTNLSTEYGITMSAISHMKKNKESILYQKQRLDELQGNTARKRFTGVEDTPLERCLYDWYMGKLSAGDRVSASTLQEQALMFNRNLNGPESFKASSGFVARFRKRYDLRSPNMEDDRVPSAEEKSEKFCRQFSQYTEAHGYKMDQLYNANEMGLLWKMLPNRAFTIKVELDVELDNPDRNNIEDRVAVMICANASGSHKLPPFVVGNDKQSRCLGNIRVLPVVYKGHTGAWMDHDLILDWYKEVFIPEITKRHRPSGERCVLLLAKLPSYPPVEKFNSISDICTVTYIPANGTSPVQPIFQGIIEKLKMVYKRNLLRLALTEDTIEDVENLVKSLTMLHCCNSLSLSWNEIMQVDIRNGWRQIFPCEISPAFKDSKLEPKDFLKIIRQLPEYSATTIEETNSWLHEDDSNPGWRIVSDEELENDVALEDKETKEWERSPKDALQGVTNFIAWYQTKWECTPQNLELLEKLRELAITEIISNKM